MVAGELSVRWARTPEELRGAVAVREQVFCREQGVSPADELDGLDEQALHLVALAPGERTAIGTLRLLPSGDGQTAKIGRVAVRRDWRRRGIATRMLEMALTRARELGCGRARLAAQLEAVALYEQAGFAIESDEFQEAGISHVWMGRALMPA